MKVLTLITGYLLILVSHSHAQSRKLIVQGPPVVDSLSGNALEEATITLWRRDDKTVFRQVRNGHEGFVIKGIPPGSYILIATHLGYRADTIPLALKKADITLTIRMQPGVEQLEEVVVHAVIPPVILRHDTLVFNAGAVANRPYASLEDLLKKLPGVEVDKDGNVTIHGQKVDKVYIDGKEFFLGDIKSATRNLPADIVSQLEVFNTQTDRGTLMGIKEETGNKAINIKLKKDRKNGVFGEAYAGAGTGSSYAAGGNLTSMRPGEMIYASVRADNINGQFDGKENNFGAAVPGIHSANDAGFKYREEWGNKILTEFGTNYGEDKSTLVQTDQQTTFLSDSSLAQHRFDQSVNNSKNYHLNGRIEGKVDSFHYIWYEGRYTANSGNTLQLDTVAISTLKNPGGYLSSTGKTINSGITSGKTMENHFMEATRFHKTGRSLFIDVNLNVQENSADAGLYSLVNRFDSSQEAAAPLLVNQHFTQPSVTTNYDGKISYSEPIGKDRRILMAYGFNGSRSHSNSQGFDYDSTSGKFDIPDTLTTNHFASYNSNNNFSLEYHCYKGSNRYHFGAAMQFTDITNRNYTTGKNVTQNYSFLSPNAGLTWDLNKFTHFEIGYHGNSIFPSIEQVQPVANLSNPYLVKLGNPNLKQEFDHTIDLSLFYNNRKGYQSLRLTANGALAENKITAASTVQPGGVQDLQYVNVDGVYHISSNLMYSFPIAKKIADGNISVNGRYGQNVILLNGDREISTTTGYSVKLGLHCHAGEQFFADADASLEQNENAYSVSSVSSSRMQTQNYNLNLSYDIPFALTVISNSNLVVTGAQTGLPAQSVLLWNTAIYRTFLQSRALQIRLSILDLMGTSSNYAQSQGANYIDYRKSNMPGRIWLFSTVYQFRRFPAGKKDEFH